MPFSPCTVVHRFIVISVLTRGYVRNPVSMANVPLDSAIQSTSEISARLPAYLISDFRRINGITPVMAGPIRDGADPLPDLFRVSAAALCDDLTNGMNNLEIGAFFAGADIVNRTDLALRQNVENRPAVVLNVKPLANLFSVAIHWKIKAVNAVSNQQRNQLFRKLIGTIVVRATRYHNR